MAEKEAIKQLQVGYLGDTEDLVQAKHIAINALSEIQQYRAIGTVEDIQLIFSLCKDLERMVKKYEAIGTIEEFKALKEKSVVKKPDFTEDKQFALCPNISCNSKGLKDKQQYCDCCGQKLDWQ